MKIKITVFIFLWSFLIMAQEKKSVAYNNAQLSNVLLDLESKFGVKFSYNSNIVINKVISLNEEEISLSEVLSEVELQVKIEFEELSERYYILKSIKKVDLTDTQFLDEVLINEYLTTGVSEAQDESVNIVIKELGILPGLTEPDVLQSIQLIPGVQSPSETAAGLYVRGGTPDQNLILWDGIKMYHSGHFFGTVSAFNPYITESIKLYKSGTKAQYGSTISSVIDITSEDDIPKSIEGGIGFNMTHADAYLKAPLGEKAAIIVSGRRSFVDAFETPTFKNLSERIFQSTKISEGNKVFEDDEFVITKDLFYFTDITLKAIFKPSDSDKVTLSNLITKNKLDYGFLIEEFEEASQDELDIENIGSSFNWTHKYNNKLSHSFNAYYSYYDLNYIGSNSIPEEFLDRLNKENSIKDFGVSFGTQWKINSKNSLNLGYQFTNSEVKFKLQFEDSEEEEESFNEESNSTNNTHAFYTDYNYNSSNKWFFSLGVRGNYISAINQVFVEPRIQLGYYITDDLQLKISSETQHQTVSQIIEFQTIEFGLENQIWALADDKTRPVLKSNQVTTGLTFNKNGWSIGLDTYYKSINGISSFSSGFERIGEPDFTEGRSKVFGLDLLLKKRINNYRTWLSYAYINNDFSFTSLNEGRDFPGNFDITHQFNWSHSYNWNNLDFSLGWIVRTGTPFTRALGVIELEDNSTVIDYEPINKSRLSTYHRLDASATYKFKLSQDNSIRGKFGVSLINIYDRKNDLSKTFRKKQNIVGSDVLREIEKTSLGFTPNIVFRVEF